MSATALIGSAMLLALLQAGGNPPAQDRYGLSGSGQANPFSDGIAERAGQSASPQAGSITPITRQEAAGTARNVQPNYQLNNGASAAPFNGSGVAGTNNASSLSSVAQPPAGVAPAQSGGLLYQPPNATSSTQSSPPPSEAITGPKPRELMRQMLTPPPGSRLMGTPVRLEQVVAGGRTRAEQSQRIDAYWDLCSSVADYYLGLREQAELAQLRRSVQRLSEPLRSAEIEMEVRVGTSLQAAMASQYRLAELMGRTQTGQLPLPGDIPQCGNYHTHYQQIFSGRQSAEARQLAALIPLRYKELQDAAAAVPVAEDWLRHVDAHRSETSTGESVLRSLELLAMRRRAFVQIARDYNRRISRYTELAAPGNISTARLVNMLVWRPEAARSQDRQTASVANGGERPMRSEAQNGTQTFQDGLQWGSPSQLPANTQPAAGAERSVLAQ